MAINNDPYARGKLGLPWIPQNAEPTPPPQPVSRSVPSGMGSTGALPANYMQNAPGPQGLAQMLAQHRVQYPQAPQYQNPLTWRGPGPVMPQAMSTFQPSSGGGMNMAELMQSYNGFLSNPLAGR